MKYINEHSGECGIYYIRNIINDKIYIGSSIMLTKRYKEHKLKLITNKHQCTILQNAVNKYGIENFEFVVIKTYTDVTDQKLRYIEGLLIRLFKSEYNICKFPESSGKPNYKRKLSNEWVFNLHKNNNYKHSDNIEKYKEIVEKNKRDSSKVILTINKVDLPEMSIVEASEYLGLKGHCLIGIKQRCRRLSKSGNEYSLRVIKTQQKRVKVIEPSKVERIFNSAGECDKFYNLWRGCTSNAICHLNGKLYENYAVYI